MMTIALYLLLIQQQTPVPCYGKADCDIVRYAPKYEYLVDEGCMWKDGDCSEGITSMRFIYQFGDGSQTGYDAPPPMVVPATPLHMETVGYQLYLSYPKNYRNPYDRPCKPEPDVHVLQFIYKVRKREGFGVMDTCGHITVGGIVTRAMFQRVIAERLREDMRKAADAR